MVEKYSWIGYALLGCHRLVWLMRLAHVDGPQTADYQPSATEQLWASRSPSLTSFSWCYCWTQPWPHEHTHSTIQARCHFCSMNPAYMRVINTVMSLPGLSRGFAIFLSITVMTTLHLTPVFWVTAPPQPSEAPASPLTGLNLHYLPLTLLSALISFHLI